MLTFWICYGFISLFDRIFVQIFDVFEFYHIARTVAIEVIYLKDFSGASYIYENIIFPCFEKIKKYVDPFIATAENMALIATK